VDITLAVGRKTEDRDVVYFNHRETV